MASPLREEIIRRIDLAAEFQKYGGRIPPGAQPNAEGWLTVHSIDREDKNPSAALNVSGGPSVRGVYVDHAPTGRGAASFFDVIARLPGSSFITGKDAYEFYGMQTGVFTGEGKKLDRPGPNLADLEQFKKNLTPETKQFLKEKRGLTDASLAKYSVGWCTKRERNAFPVFDESNTLRHLSC